jgi:RHS repeat-associated protein
MSQEIYDYLEQRLGRVHVHQRLGIEAEYEARVFHRGLSFFHLENWYSVHTVIRNSLRLVGLCGRGRRDANGNPLTKGSDTYAYDPDNRLIHYQGNAASYVYNSQGQRTAKTTGATTTRYAYDEQGRLLGEYGPNTKEYIYLDDEPLAIIDNNNIYYVHNDHLATPQQITNQIQTVVWAADYEPFGEVTTTVNTVENNLRFPGQYYNAETSLHYNGARYYDPKIGRYISSDPIGLEGGVNTYAYVRNNPLRYIDPRGLVPICVTSAGQGFPFDCDEGFEEPSCYGCQTYRRVCSQEYYDCLSHIDPTVSAECVLCAATRNPIACLGCAILQAGTQVICNPWKNCTYICDDPGYQ